MKSLAAQINGLSAGFQDSVSGSVFKYHGQEVNEDTFKAVIFLLKQ